VYGKDPNGAWYSKAELYRVRPGGAWSEYGKGPNGAVQSFLRCGSVESDGVVHGVARCGMGPNGALHLFFLG